MTPMDQADMMNRTMTTALASEPIWLHRDAGIPTDGAACFLEQHKATILAIAKALFLLSCELNLCFTLDRTGRRSACRADLLAQREVHVDLSDHLHRLAVEESRLVHPLFHRFERGRDQQRVAADHLEILNRAVLGDDRGEAGPCPRCAPAWRAADRPASAGEPAWPACTLPPTRMRCGVAGFSSTFGGGGGGGAAVGTEPMMPPSTPPGVPPATPPGTPPTTPALAGAAAEALLP